MKVYDIPLKELHPHPRNPRKAGPKAVSNLVEAITGSGWTQPIIANRRKSGRIVVLAGHHRLKAAQEIHRRKLTIPHHPDTSTAPVMLHEGLSPARESADLIADNQRHTSWDSAVLAEELKRAGKFYTGFSTGDVARMINSATAEVKFAEMEKTTPQARRTMTCTLTTPKKAAALAEYCRKNKI